MPEFRVLRGHLRLIYCITYNSIQMNNLALKWHDIDVSFIKENDEVMVNLTDMAKGFPKKDLRHIMNSKEMREYIQAVKRRYESRKSETQICVSTDNQSVTHGETKRQICHLPDSQSVTDGETKTQICSSLNEDQKSETQIYGSLNEDQKSEIRNLILPDSQSVTYGETRIQNCILPDFQTIRVVHGGSKGEHGTFGTWRNCSKNNHLKNETFLAKLRNK